MHAISGRARLRVDERVRDGAYFDALARELAKHALVREVHVNAATGSVLVLHDGAIGEVLEDAAGKGLLALVPRAPAVAMRRLRESVETLDTKIARSTFAAGVATGATLPVVAPALVEAGRPLAKSLLKQGILALDRIKTETARGSESLLDLIAEVRSEVNESLVSSAQNATPSPTPNGESTLNHESSGTPRA